MLKYNQSNEELNSTKIELYITKDKLDKAGNDIDKKTKYIDELKKIEKTLVTKIMKSKNLKVD